MNTSPLRGEVDLEGKRLSALLFPIDTSRIRGLRLSRALIVALLIFFGSLPVWFLLTASPRSDAFAFVARTIWIVGVLFFAAILVLLVVSWRKAMLIALVPEGIYSEDASGKTLVPWDTITATGDYVFAGCRYLGIRTSAHPRKGARWTRFIRPMNRKLAGWHLTYPLFVMRGAVEFERLVQLCVADPAERSRLAAM